MFSNYFFFGNQHGFDSASKLSVGLQQDLKEYMTASDDMRQCNVAWQCAVQCSAVHCSASWPIDCSHVQLVFVAATTCRAAAVDS